MNEKVGNKFERMMRILSILSEYRWITANQLAKELGVDKRTIKRYIRDINIPFEDQGLGLIESSKEGYRLWDTTLLDKLKGIDDQYVIAAIQLSPFGEALHTKPILKEEIQSKIIPRINKANTFSSENSRIILEAFLKNRVLHIQYIRPNGETKEYEVLPLKSILNNDTNYLLCYCLDQGYKRILNFVVDNISQITTGDVFRNRRFIEEQLKYIDSRWGTFVNDSKEFEADVTFEVDNLMYERLIRNPLHITQEYKGLSSEGRHLFFVKVHNAQEFARWTMKYGWHIKVLEPDIVTWVLKTEAENMLEKYGD